MRCQCKLILQTSLCSTSRNSSHSKRQRSHFYSGDPLIFSGAELHSIEAVMKSAGSNKISDSKPEVGLSLLEYLQPYLL